MSQLAELYVWGWSPFPIPALWVHMIAARRVPESEEPFPFPVPGEEWGVKPVTFRRARAKLLEVGYLTETGRAAKGRPMEVRFEYPEGGLQRPLAALSATPTTPLAALSATPTSFREYASPLIKNLEPISEGAPAPRGKGGARKRASETPFPVGKFIITEEMRAWIEKEGYGRLNLRLETERFRDHALTNDRRVRDWVAAWRNWIRKAAEFQKVEKVPIQDTIKPLVWDPEADYAK